MLVRSICGRPGWKTGQRVGVEIELENCPPDSHRASDALGDMGWQLIGDGSLRNGGWELISRPTLLSNIGPQVDAVYEIIRSHGYGCRGTLRTGTHVHFDMLRQNFEAVAAVCTVYALVEPALYAYLAPERAMGSYCVPWYVAPDEARELAGMVTLQQSEREIARVLERNCCKYSGLNLRTLREHGTLEFRMAQTFDTATELREWIDILAELVQVGLSFGTAAKVLKDATQYGIQSLLPRLANVDALATTHDAWYCAELLGGVTERSWKTPELDLSDWEAPEDVPQTLDEMLQEEDAVVLPRGLRTPVGMTQWTTTRHTLFDGVAVDDPEYHAVTDEVSSNPWPDALLDRLQQPDSPMQFTTIASTPADDDQQVDDNF